MVAPVPWKRTDPPRDEVLIGAPVRGALWTDSARLLHYVRGFGNQIIPQHNPATELPGGGSRTFRYRTSPSPVAILRIWIISAWVLEPTRIGQPATENGLLLIQAGSAAPATVTVAPGVSENTGYRINTIAYREELAAKAVTTLEDTSITLTNLASGDGPDIYIEGIECWEAPRAALSLDTTDYGVDLRTLEQASPIFKASAQSLGGLAEAWEATRTVRHLLNFALPVVRFNGASFEDAFVRPIPIRPSRDLNADSRTVQWDVYARAESGTTGEVRVVTGSGTTTAAESVSNTSDAWLGPFDVTVDNEDFDDPDGLPAGGIETVQLQGRRLTGTGDIVVLSFPVFERRP